MLIKEIELNNFRIYKGRNLINLLPSDDKNVVVVSGKNGYGKTTFLVSLVWCLYGKQMGKVDDLYQKEIRDKGSYPKYIADCLNRKAKLEDETKFSVSVTFTGVKIPDTESDEVKITRTHDILSGEDKVEILIDGFQDEITRDLSINNPSGEEVFIRELILPIDIAKFFLFDAEKIVALAEVNSPQQRRDLSVAYSEVLGIKKYEDMKKELEIILDETRKKSANPQDEKDLIEITAKIGNLEIENKTLNEKIEELKEEKTEKKKDSDDIQTKLIQEGKLMTLEELNRLRTERKSLEEKSNNLKKELKELYDFIPFALAGEVLVELQEQLEKEQEIKKTQYKQSDVEDKTTKVINDIENARQQENLSFDKEYIDFYHREIKKQIRKHFFSNIPNIPANFQTIHDLPSSDLAELNHLINQLQHSFSSNLERINQDFYITDNNYKSIDRKITNAEKEEEDDYIRSLRERKEKLDQRILEIDQELEEALRKSENIRIDKVTHEKRQEELRQKIDDSMEFSEQEAVVKKTLNLIKENITRHQQKKKESLEKNMLTGLNTLLHKKDFIKEITVNINTSGEDIDIALKNDREEKIDKVSLSMGERQMYASALLNALVDESDIEFPVFIDSPMQKFDEEHAENIIRHFYPNVSKQVVIFPLINKELTANEYNILKDKVSKAYLIQNINHDASQFLEIKPEELIESYNQS